MKKKNFIPYLFILPSLIILGFVFYYPILRVGIDSFYKFSVGKVFFEGINNYIFLFSDINAKTAVLNNVKLLLTVPILLIISLILAFVFFTGVKGGRIYQVLIFVPKVISIVVIGVVFSYLLRQDGMINYFLKSINLSFLAKDWLGDAKIAIYSIVGTIVWQELGFGIMIFLAKLSSIEEDILDSAKVDGANWFQLLIHIVIPQLKWVINFFIIYHVMVIFAWVFTWVYVTTGGGPARATTVIELEIYKYAFNRNMRGVASAFSILLLVGSLIFIYFYNMVQRKMEE